HGIRHASQQAVSADSLIRPRLSLWVLARRPGRSRADSHGRLPRRRADGRAARLLRPTGRYQQRAAADHDLTPVLAAPADLVLAGGDVLLHEGGWRVMRADVVVRAGRIEAIRSEEHTSELQSRGHLVCRLLLEKK